MKTLEYHEAANIFPLDEEHIGELAEDIRKHGLEVMIKTLDGKIIDGRRRYLACQRAGVTPTFREVKVADPIAYVVSLNLHRRQLNSSQRAMCAARASEMQERLEKEAKERMKEAGARGGKASGASRRGETKGTATVPEPSGEETRDKLGKAFNVGGRSVSKAENVLEKAEPELIEAVDDGRLSVSAAEEFAEAEPEIQREVAEKAKFSGGRYRKPKLETEPDPKPGEIKLVGVGVFRANEAINCLTRIPKNDQLRSRGLQIVTDWIKAHK